MTHPTEKASKDEVLYKELYLIPPKYGRYVVLDTETTGLKKNDHVVELGAHEILDGKLTGGQFHIYIKPRLQMEEIVIRIHQITNDYYHDFYEDIYTNDKQNLINFINWVGDSLIFAHNATFDMNALNLELRYWGLPEFPKEKFRCSMRIFKEIIGRIEPYFTFFISFIFSIIFIFEIFILYNFIFTFITCIIWNPRMILNINFMIIMAF